MEHSKVVVDDDAAMSPVPTQLGVFSAGSTEVDDVNS